MRSAMSETHLVVAAAVRRNGLIFTMPRPSRHAHILDLMDAESVSGALGEEQGFLLSDGTFANRAFAMSVARNSGQVPKVGGTFQESELFSEDLW